MAEQKKGVTIVIKKIKPHGHAAHGGAWKVAYADFVTAMMAFFLVLWLLGSDEEIKASVSQYFNNPSSIWNPNLQNKEMVPLGDRTGAGESVMNGADGTTPDDLVERPARQFQLHTQEGEDDGDVIQPLLAGKDIVDIEVLKFSIPIRTLFKPGSETISAEARKALEKIGKITRGYKGYLSVAADPLHVHLPNGKEVDPYEFALTRSVNVGKFLVENKFINENQLTTKVRKNSEPRAEGDSADSKKQRRIASVVEFYLTVKKP